MVGFIIQKITLLIKFISRVIFCCWYFSSVYERNFKFLWYNELDSQADKHLVP